MDPDDRGGACSHHPQSLRTASVPSGVAATRGIDVKAWYWALTRPRCAHAQAWPIWLGLPLALAASSLFLLNADAPARTMYRVGGHVCLVASIGAYQWLWTAMGISAA